MILDQFSLKGKSGIVTGGGTGLGKAMATAVVQAGAEILIVGRRREVLDEAAREMNRFGGPIIPFQADITKMGDIPKIVDRAIKEFRKIDFLFNNAGKGHPSPCVDDQPQRAIFFSPGCGQEHDLGETPRFDHQHLFHHGLHYAEG
jgi:NAD(P)-dependent dehydrogenase (short-subunit alcohol dehydrogenase family)